VASIRVQHLSFLDWKELALSVSEGEIVSIFGKSGSGKSLFLRAVADLIPWEGAIVLDGVSCLEIDPPLWRRQVIYLPSEVLWWSETVSEHFESEPNGGLLRRLNLANESMDWAPTRLSMGERQRLGLLRALDRQPQVLLLDEPTANLDEEATQAVEGIVREYVEERSACAIWVSHDQEQVGRVASRVFRMEDRKLVEQSR